MEIRTTSQLVTFCRPFHFAGLDAVQPAGTYTMDVEEERLDTLSVAGWRRIAVRLKLTRGGTTEHVTIDMQDLREALLRDGDQSTEPPSAPAAAQNPRLREILHLRAAR
jgi:hypothetical protein